MRVLFATGSPARYMLPPVLGEAQVNCGPDWPDQTGPDGRVHSLATPVGAYDLATIAARLPAEQQPEVVVCLVDASWRNLPRNLAAFRCPRVLLVADTHHQSSPLIGMVRYLAAEPFDRIVFLYDRHHADFFRAAGFANLHWFPGLTFPHSDAEVAAARAPHRETHVAFVGQVGRLHPRRTRLLEALSTRGLAVARPALPQREALRFYGQSLLAFNASLNADLNLRVFEALAAGAALLTDRLAPAAGLGRLLRENGEFIPYCDAGELADRAAHFLRHPAEAAAIGAAGARWFDAHLNEARRRTAFQALAFDGVSLPEFAFAPEETTRFFFGGNTDRLLQAMMVYEGVQELHRTQETVRLELAPDTPAELPALFATLPRVQLGAAAPGKVADLAVFGHRQAEAASATGAGRLWCHDVGPDDLPALAARYASAGFVLASRAVAVFERTPAAVPALSPAEAAAQDAARARTHLTQGDPQTALALARSALEKDGRCVAALVLIGELALASQGGPLAEKLFRQALQWQPGDLAIEAQLGNALCQQNKLRLAAECFERVLRARPTDLAALLALSRLQLAEQRPEAAEATLREAVRHHPADPGAARALGDFLKRHGHVFEALTWHRRGLGSPAAVRPVDPRGRSVRVAFLVQHPQGWTSTKSVWEAFAADPACTTLVIAAPYQHPYPPEGGPEAIYGFLRGEGVPFVPWNEYLLLPDFADVLFVQNPYDVTRPEPLRTPQLLKLVPRLAYVPYGLEIGGGEENAQNQFNLPLQHLAWAVFARSDRHRAMFARHCSAGDAHVTVTGHPRLDPLRTLDSRPADPEFAAFARGRKIIFWNPQFDVRPDGTGYSTFMLWQEFLLEEFARRPELAFVIRPHPLFFGTLERRGLWSATQVAGFLARVERAGNVLIDRRASYLPIFAASAAMLSDASTFLLEYPATGKPLLYLHNPRGPQLNADGEFVRTHSYTAERREELVAFLDMVAAGADPRAAARRAAYGQVMHAPAGGVAQAIKHTVLERLAAERSLAPAGHRAPATASAPPPPALVPDEQQCREQSRAFWKNCANTHLADPGYYARAAQALADRLPRFVRPGIRVIDVGCGNGEMTLAAAQAGADVTGYDVSEALVRAARARARELGARRARFEVLDLERGLAARPADVVLCLGVFSCIHDDEVWLRTLDQFAAMIPAGGTLFLRESVMGGSLQRVRHANGYYACYRPEEAYLAAVTARGFREIDRVQLAGQPEGLVNRLWVFRRTSATVVPAPAGVEPAAASVAA